MRASGTAVVAGASSQLGLFLLPRLAAGGYSVKALSRGVHGNPVAAAEGVTWVAPGSIPAGPTDFFFSCGPLRLAREILENTDGLKKAVVFSTTSVFTKPGSPDEKERSMIREIAQEEDRLKTAGAARNIALVIIRPTLVYGCGMDGNVSLLLRMGERTGLIPLSRRASGLRQPVHADDLAHLAVAAMQADTGPLLEGEACGGESLAFREMAARIASCGRRRIRLLALPPTVLNAAVRVASKFGQWKGLNPEMVNRQAEDMVFDDTPFRETLDWNPRPFNPSPEDFHIPAFLEKYRPPP